jgi:hypothetical protein
MNKIQNEFEIIVRSQLIIPSDKMNLSLSINSNVQRRHSMDTSHISPTHSTVMKSKSPSIESLDQIPSPPIEDSTLSKPLIIDNEVFNASEQEEKPPSFVIKNF